MLPKEGKDFPERGSKYSITIACALRQELGDSHRAAKTIMSWTGVNERTAKNWLSGANGPSGEHLISLVNRSSTVFDAFLHLSGQHHALAAKKLVDARDTLTEMLETIEQLLP